MATSELQPIGSLAEVAPGYAAIFCDVWGVVHDGVRKHAAAEAALLAARGAGTRVFLLTNSPRRAEGVAAQLGAMAIDPAAYDGIVTSGDVTRDLIVSGGRRVYHLGPERDLDLFEDLPVDLVPEDEAQIVVATGLKDDLVETAADYAPQLARLAGRGLAMVCANPDLVVHRGERLVHCAGALARDYEAIGGAVRMAGKPFAPIYALAERRAGVSGPREVLAVGDGLNTDIRGANGYGADALLIVEGIHRDELGGGPDGAAGIAAALGAKGLAARYMMPALR